jgi:hypothetical protein
MATVIILAVGALVVMFIAGLSSAVPGPDAFRSDEPWPRESAPRGTGAERPRLPAEILDALTNPRGRLGSLPFDEPQPAVPSRGQPSRQGNSHQLFDATIHDDSVM